MKKILLGDKVPLKLKTGIDKITEAVAVTLGPRGGKVGIFPNWQLETYLNIDDGVTVAQNFSLQDGYENFGAGLVKVGAQRQVEEVGDGTTVTVILTQAIFNECLKVISTGVNPRVLVDGLNKAKPDLLKALDDMTAKISTEQDKVNVATIASGYDDLGKMIGETIHKMGDNGVVVADKGTQSETEVEILEGMQFERGYLSQIFITDPRRMEATVEKCYILLLDKPLSDINAFDPFWKKVAALGGSLVVIAPGFEGEVLPSFVITKRQGGFPTLPVNPPMIGENQRQFLADIAVLTGGQVVGEVTGSSFAKLETDVLGYAKRVTQTKDSTMIVGGGGMQSQIDERIESIRVLLETETSKYEIEKLKERIAKLTKGVAVIRIGGATEVEINDKYEKAKDAIPSTKVAVEEGIVPGGEMALFNLSLFKNSNQEDNIAYNILRKALKQPFKRLLENSGLDYAEMFQKVSEGGVQDGIDVTLGEVCNMMTTGIVDPVKVVKSALTNAISIASEAIETKVLIIEEPDKK